MKFKSKVDWWLKTIVIFVLLLTLYFIAGGIFGGSKEQLISAGICAVIIIGIFVPVYLFTYYAIEGNNLLIRSGFFYKKTINISSIKAIGPTHNPVSSAALSINRIAIYYSAKRSGKMSTEFISPEKKQEFINALKSINSDIIVKDA